MAVMGRQAGEQHPVGSKRSTGRALGRPQALSLPDGELVTLFIGRYAQETSAWSDDGTQVDLRGWRVSTCRIGKCQRHWQQMKVRGWSNKARVWDRAGWRHPQGPRVEVLGVQVGFDISNLTRVTIPLKARQHLPALLKQ